MPVTKLLNDIVTAAVSEQCPRCSHTHTLTHAAPKAPQLYSHMRLRTESKAKRQAFAFTLGAPFQLSEGLVHAADKHKCRLEVKKNNGGERKSWEV